MIGDGVSDTDGEELGSRVSAPVTVVGEFVVITSVTVVGAPVVLPGIEVVELGADVVSSPSKVGDNVVTILVAVGDGVADIEGASDEHSP